MDDSILAENRELINDLLDIAAYSIKADLEIVNTNLDIILKTGQNANLIAGSLGETIYSQVLKSEGACIIDNPRKSIICTLCAEKNRCLKKMEMAFPIIADNTLYGILGVFCYNLAQKEQIMKDMDTTLDFIKKMINRIESGISLTLTNKNLSDKNSSLKKSINEAGYGYLQIDSNHFITDCNSLSKSLLNIQLGKSIVHKKMIDNNRNLFSLCCDTIEIKAKGYNYTLDYPTDEAKEMMIFTCIDDYYVQDETDISSKDTSFQPVICGSSEEMIRLRTKISKMAKTNSTILIIGERGSGKELCARRIHYESNRKNDSFITVDCRNVSSKKLYQEIFGGSSQNDKGLKATFQGKLHLANGGVIYIENIEYMPSFIWDGIIKIIKNKESDIRFLFSAENPDFMQRFSECGLDGFDKINVIPLKVPALRNIKSDLPELIDYFLNKYKNNLYIDIPSMGSDIIDLLVKNNWQNNVRELELVIMSILDAHKAGVDINTELINSLLSSIKDDDIYLSNGTASKQLKSLREVENEYIALALAKYGYSTFGKKKAAKELGIGIATLYRKIGEKNTY